MILLNQHLESGKTYKSDREMFPHLYDDSGRKVAKMAIYFDESGENIIVEADIQTRAELREVRSETENFIKREKEKARERLRKIEQERARLENILKTLSEAEGGQK
jgi:hypothetical protein